MGTIADKLNLLENTKEEIKAAIVAKGQSVTDTEPFSAYPDKISAIQTGMGTSDATATASDIAQGKTAYVKGSKVTGSIVDVGSNSSTTYAYNSMSNSSSNLDVQSKKTIHDVIMRVGSAAITSIPMSNFGDATAANVLSGKTFTSSAGLKVTGTMPTKAATTITPGTSAKTAISAGTYASGAITVVGDANLTAANIVSGKSIFGVSGNATVSESIKLTFVNNTGYSIKYRKPDDDYTVSGYSVLTLGTSIITVLKGTCFYFEGPGVTSTYPNGAGLSFSQSPTTFSLLMSDASTSIAKFVYIARATSTVTINLARIPTVPSPST